MPDAVLDRFLNRVASALPSADVIGKKDPEPGWRQLHRIADAIAPKLRKPFLSAIAAAKAAANVEEIEAALDRGDITGATKVLDRAWAGNGRRVMESEFLAPFMAGFRDAGLVSVKLVSPTLFDFAIDNPRGLAWAKEHAAELVVQLGDETIRGLNLQVQRMLEAGMPAREAAKAIRGVQGFGLTERQALAVENYRTGLLGQDIAAGRVNRLVSRYYETMLDYRAMTIARTESAFAVNAGYHETLLQAVDEGLLDVDNTVRYWETAGDTVVCDFCAAIAEAGPVGIMEPFVDPRDGSKIMFPPLHPDDRCAVVTEQLNP